MSAKENPLNPSTTRPADLIVDGWRRGVHYRDGGDYVSSMDVTGLLPRLLIGRRDDPPVRHAAGVRQVFGVPELDGPLFVASTGLDFPKALVRHADARQALVQAQPGLRFVEVAEPVLGVTGVVVSTRLSHAAGCLDLAAGVLRAVDDLLARATAFPDAAAALAEKDPPAPPDPEPVVVEALVARVASAASWLQGPVARVGDTVEGRLTLSEAGLELEGTLRLAWRDAAASVVDAALDVAVPDVPWGPLNLSAEKGAVSRVLAEDKTGDDDLDSAWVSLGDVRHARAFKGAKDIVLGLARRFSRIEISESRLRVLVPPAARDEKELFELCGDLLELWRRTTIARAG